MKAFFYNEEYYLLPEDYSTVKDFQKSLFESSVVALTKCVVKKCLPPFFVREYLTNVILNIEDPEHIYPCEVTILTQKKYDERLSLCVKQTCNGCVRFGGDYDNLEGHHEEICLNGVCFERKEKYYYTLKLGAEAFWEKFSKNQRTLRKLIHEEKYEEAADKVRELMGRHIGFLSTYHIAVGKHGKKYVLMYSSLGSSMSYILFNYVLSLADEKITKSWLLYPYLPKDIYQYRPVFEGYDVRQTPPKVSIKSLEMDHTRISLAFLMEDCDYEEVSATDENYKYICSRIGENVLNGILDRLHFTTEPEEDNDYQSFSAVEDFIRDNYDAETIQLYGEKMFGYSFGIESSENQPVRDDSETIFTECLDFTMRFVGSTANKKVDGVMENLNLKLGCVKLHLEREDRIDEQIRYTRNHIIQPLLDAHYIVLVDTCTSDRYLYYDFVVIVPDLTKKMLRASAPVLMAMKATYTEMDLDNTVCYDADFEFDVHTENLIEGIN